MRIKSASVINIWLATGLLIAGIVAIAVSSQRIIVKNTAEAFNRQQLFLVRQAARGIEQSIDTISAALQTAADRYAENRQQAALQSLTTHYRGLMLGVLLVGTDGAIRASYPLEPAALSQVAAALGRALPAAVAGGARTVVTDIFMVNLGVDAALTFIVGVPVPDRSAWLCCIVDFDAIKQEFVYPIRSGRTGYAWMINDRGVLLAHPNQEMEGRKALDVLRQLWPENSSYNLETLINSEMSRGEEGKGEYRGWHIGEKQLTLKLIAFCPIRLPGRSWSIGVSAPYGEVMAPLMASITGPLVFIACFIAVILTGAVLLIRQERNRALAVQQLQWSYEVFDAITDGISIIDRDYRVLMVNQTVSRLQGRPKSYFIGKPCYDVFQQERETCRGCPAVEMFQTGKPVFRERVSTTLQGQKYYFHLSAFPLKDRHGNIVRVAECVKDVTREMQLRSQLLQHERTSMIVKMSAQVAHEIRNPLGSLTLHIDLLEEELTGYRNVDVAEGRNLIAQIKTEIDGLHRVLQEYLECTRFPTIRPELQDMHLIVEGVLSMLEEELRQRRILFRTRFEYNLPLVPVDRDQIRRALVNIIQNAEDAMGPGGTIEVETRSVDDWVEVLISDTGPGIGSDLAEKIFNPFFTTKTGGTGLGLAITQHIVTEHGGEILCQQRGAPAQGTCFVIRLPLKPGHAEDDMEQGDNG